MHPITAAFRGHHSVAGPGYIKARHGALRIRSDLPSCRDGCSRPQLFLKEYGRSRLFTSVKQKHGRSRFLHPRKVREFSAFILARFGCSRFCLRLTHGSSVLGRYLCRARAFPALPPLDPRPGYSRPFSVHQSMGVLGFASAFHSEKPAPLQKPRITVRDHSNAQPNPRVAHGPPQTFGQPIRAVTRPSVAKPRARQQPHAFRNNNSTYVRRHCRRTVNK